VAQVSDEEGRFAAQAPHFSGGGVGVVISKAAMDCHIKAEAGAGADQGSSDTTRAAGDQGRATAAHRLWSSRGGQSPSSSAPT